MTEQPSLTLEWLTKLFEDNVRSGRQVSAEKIAEIHQRLDLLVAIYARSGGAARKASYPAHDAAQNLQPLVAAAHVRWIEKSAAWPSNELAKTAVRLGSGPISGIPKSCSL